MTPIREQILLAIKAKLAAITVPTGLKVYRNKTTENDSYPALVLMDGGHDVTNDQTQFPIYQMSLSVQGFVQNKDEALIGGLVNELYAAVVVALTTDVSQGNLAFDTRETGMVVDLNQDDDDKVTAACEIGFTIEFATKYGNPGALAP